MAVGDTVEGKYGNTYYECTVLELREQTLKVRWTHGSENDIARYFIPRKPQQLR